MGVIDFSINEDLLGKLVEWLGTEIFFETGTFRGVSLRIARRHVDRCMSVEMSQSLYEAARALFADDPSIELFLGDSPTVIADHQAELAARKTLFWLDAHWCTDDASAGAESQSPLIGELEAIGRLDPASAILIDDARLYTCTPPPPHRYTDWPTFDQVLKALLALSDSHRVMLLNDVIVYFPESIEPQVAAYASEHSVDWRHIAGDARKYQRVRRMLKFWKPAEATRRRGVR